MQFGVWAFIGLLAFITMAWWMLFENRIPVTTVTSGFLWFQWGFNATSVETGTPVVIEQAYPALQYFGFFLGIVNLALLAMWLWTDEDEDLFESDW